MKKVLVIVILNMCILVNSSLGQEFGLLWARSLNATTQSGSPLGYSNIVTDKDGKFLVAGSFNGTISLNPGLATDKLTSAGYADAFILKLDHLGNVIWFKQIGSSGDDHCFSITVDAQGNIYVTGSITGSVDLDPGSNTYILNSNNGGYFIEKLDGSGNFIWAKQSNISASIFISPNQSLFSYVNQVYDISLTKHDLDGNVIWSKSMGGINGKMLDNSSLTADANDNVYIVGSYQGRTQTDPATGNIYVWFDIFIAKFDAVGNLQWKKQFGGNESDKGSGIAVDVFGNIYVTGYFGGTCDFDPSANNYNLSSAGNDDIFIAKFDNSGNLVWAKGFGSTLQDNGTSIAVDAQGNIYSTGFFQWTIDLDPGTGKYELKSVGDWDVFLCKLNTNGDFLFAKSFGGNNGDLGLRVAIDQSNNVYLSGAFNGTADFDPGINTFNLTASAMYDMFIAKFGIKQSQITINNIIDNNSKFPDPQTLWTGTTNQTAPVIKICADGSKATEITFVNNTGINSNNIRFWISSDPYGNNSDLSGYFVTDTNDYHVNGNIIKAKLTHPKYLPSNYKPSRSDAIQIVDYTNPSPSIYFIPIEIYRAPVVMVHGLWGNDETFSEMSRELVASGLYPIKLLQTADYRSSNGGSFEENKDIVPKNINLVLMFARYYNFSAGKVDVICHSMGGILARNYLQSEGYGEKKDIHKLITINTPHFGSPWGNLLTNPWRPESQDARTAAIIIAPFFFSGSIFDGAIEDLSINSAAMKDLNYNKLNNGKVPSHTIITQSSVLNDGIFFLILKAVAPVAGMSLEAYVNYLFNGEANDLVVPVTSQSGGLPLVNSSNIPNQWHIGSSANSFVITEVKSALNLNSSDINYFAQNGFVPKVISSPYRTNQIKPIMRMQSNSIKINSPLRNQSFNKGDKLQLNISSTNGIKRIVLEAMNIPSNSIAIDTTMSNGIIDYTIPINGFGQILFLALGYNSDQLVGYDTLSIIIKQTSSLQSISFNTDTLFIEQKNTSSLSINANYSDGNSYSISRQPDIKYQIADTNIAMPYYLNTIRGKQIGSTTLSVTYLNQTKNIDIIVVPRDTTLKEVNAVPTPKVTAEGPINICEGDSVTLSSNLIVGNQWIKNGIPISGATTPTLNVKSVGSYELKVFLNGYESPGSNTIIVTSSPLPPRPSITQNGNQLISSSTSGNQWYLNGNIISGATGQTYAPSSTGNYSVQDTINNCVSEMSAVFNFIVTAVQNIEDLQEFAVMPNPNNGLFFVKLNFNYAHKVTFRLFNVVGTTVYNSPTYEVAGKQTKEINVKALPTGLYLLEVKVGKQILIEKIAITR